MTESDAARVYLIGGRQAAELTPDLVGGKAAGLARLHALGLNVPPALALPTALSHEYMDRGALSDDFYARLTTSLRQLEEATGLMLGGRRPLLVSVRSSPPVSMPGMLSTVLDVGVTDAGVRDLTRCTGNPWLAWDVYRRSIRSFAEIVRHAPPELFDALTREHLARSGAETLQELDAISMRTLARACADLVTATGGEGFPFDPVAQIVAAVEAVLKSWSSPRAREYRRLNGVDERMGTGVLVQAMVFGNSGPRSGSGVGFTRNPGNGSPELYVDFVFNAQGEDVVAGRLPIVDMDLLPAALPHVWTELQAAQSTLERAFRDMQDFEFTVADGRLFFLQTRPGKRTPWAALRIAADLVREGILDPPSALARLAPYDLPSIARVVVTPTAENITLARAIPASIGVASGRIVFDADRSRQLAEQHAVILVRSELTTDDVAGLAAAEGILTAFGGRTAHAAVVARQLGKVCLVGCADLRIDQARRRCSIGPEQLHEGDVITLDGETGLVYRGAVPVMTEHPAEDLALVARWREQEPARPMRSDVFDGRNCQLSVDA